MADLGNIITALEQLAADVESKSRDEPQDVERTLQKALSRTSELIRDAIPQKKLQNEWLSQLSTIDDACQNQSSQTHPRPNAQSTERNPVRKGPGSESELCNCPLEGPQVENSSTEQPPRNFVQCIHGCNAMFCSATCRKRRMRDHRSKCQALLRKEILRKVGFNSSEELF